MPYWLKTRAGWAGLVLLLIAGLTTGLMLRAQPRPGAYVWQYQALAAQVISAPDDQIAGQVQITEIAGHAVTLTADWLPAPVILSAPHLASKIEAGADYTLTPMPGGVLALHDGQALKALASKGDRARQLITRQRHGKDAK